MEHVTWVFTACAHLAHTEGAKVVSPANFPGLSVISGAAMVKAAYDQILTIKRVSDPAEPPLALSTADGL